jgi:hypothetical protein
MWKFGYVPYDDLVLEILSLAVYDYADPEFATSHISPVVRLQVRARNYDEISRSYSS